MVSIIMPFKNAEKWIEATLDSVREQSLEDWELLCIDDNSNDSSADCVQKLIAHDPRIQLLPNKGKGIIPALQTGLHAAQGEMITRMDADDLMPADRLEKMVTELEDAPKKTVVTGKVHYFGETKVSDGYRKYERWINERVVREDFYDHIYRECVVASPNWLARTEEMRQFNIISSLSYPEDYDMVFRWFQNGFTIRGIDDITLLWREHPERTSRNSDTYDQASFFRLKLNWFIQLQTLSDKRIGILGTGIKGKTAHSHLSNHGIEIQWYDLHHSNYGAGIEGKTIKDPMEVDDDVLLLCVYPNSLNAIYTYLKHMGYVIGQNAWFL